MSINDAELDRRLAGLPRAVDVPAAVWTRIERRIAPRRRPWIGSVAASVVLIAVAGLLVLSGPDKAGPADPEAVVIAAEVDAMRRSAPDPSALMAANLDQAWHSAWIENLAAIDELEKALERNPDNRLLMDFLARARLRQSELINQAVAGGAMASHRSI